MGNNYIPSNKGGARMSAQEFTQSEIAEGCDTDRDGVILDLRKHITELEAALNNAADDIVENGKGVFKEAELAEKYRAIAKNKK